MAQTAVDWLVNKIYMVIPNEERNFLEGLREQTKEIEKEQIERAYQWDRFPCTEKEAEDYYNETYNK